MTDELFEQVLRKNDMYVEWKTTSLDSSDYERSKRNFTNVTRNL